jgi:Neprosin
MPDATLAIELQGVTVGSNLIPDQPGLQPHLDTNDEIIRHFQARLRRRTIVATTRTPSGQILDWVPVESQVPGEAIAVPPPATDEPSPGMRESEAPARFELQDERAERGPAGSVPIVRKDLSSVPITMPLGRYMPKRSPDGRWFSEGTGEEEPAPPDPAGGSYIHCASGTRVTCWGGDGVINVWDPSTETFQDHSLMQIGLQNFDEPQVQAVEAGWIVCQQLNGDGLPHLFAYYTTNGHGPGADNVGGYNLEFDGWVQYDQDIYPGALITGSSIRGGRQGVIGIKYQWYQGNWWLQVQGRWLGYYPTSLFMGNRSVFATLGDNAEFLGFWGEVGTIVNPNQTTTQMGSGQYAESGWQQACYQSNLRMQTDRDGTMAPFNGSPQVDEPRLYDMQPHMNSGTSWGSYFWAGGPGAPR